MAGQESTSTTPRGPPSSWRALLTSAVRTPGLVHEAYTRFHEYSLHNQLLALFQCLERGIMPGPLHTFPGWLGMGRSVRKGEKALVLCTPVTKRDGDEDVVMGFQFRARWFALSQTQGDEYEPVSVPDWDESRALVALGVERVAFEALDGNTQGYAMPGKRVAVSPVAALPHKTLFHELAHVLLHAEDNQRSRAVKEVEAESVALLCLEALHLPGAEYARGYLQHYLKNAEFSEESSQRAIQAAQRILAAGALDIPG